MPHPHLAGDLPPAGLPTADLGDRYGAPARWRRPARWAAVAVVAAVFLGWLAWAAWFHGTPQVSSKLVGYRVSGDHEAVAVVQVAQAETVASTCRVRAFAEDHTTVGEVAFAGQAGRSDVVVRTERRATSLELLGCTAQGQPRPR